MVLKTFPNVVGCNLDKAITLIDTYLKAYGVNYSLKSVTYNRIKFDQKKNEIIIYLDKFNEVISTPYIQYDELHLNKNVNIQEEDDDFLNDLNDDKEYSSF